MDRIMREAAGDCAKSGITAKYTITELSYCDFLSEYEPVGAEGGEVPRPGHEPVTHGDGVSVATEEGVPPSEVSRLRAELAAKDEAMAAKDEAMAAKDHKIAQLEALLQSASAGGNA